MISYFMMIYFYGVIVDNVQQRNVHVKWQKHLVVDTANVHLVRTAVILIKVCKVSKYIIHSRDT